MAAFSLSRSMPSPPSPRRDQNEAFMTSKFVGRFHIVHISECTATHRAAGYAHPAYLRLTPRSKKPISVVMNQVVWLVSHPYLSFPSDGAHVLAELRRIGEGRNEYQPNSGVFD